MALNIKNEETHRMVRELAALKGVSLVAAVNLKPRERRWNGKRPNIERRTRRRACRLAYGNQPRDRVR